MSLTQFLWSLTGSMLKPMILVLRLSNSGLSFAMYPSSVVHTGVKSFGCEKRIAHLSPIHSWKRIFPSVVSAVKSGASSPIRTAIFDLRLGGGPETPWRWRVSGPELSVRAPVERKGIKKLYSARRLELMTFE